MLNADWLTLESEVQFNLILRYGVSRHNKYNGDLSHHPNCNLFIYMYTFRCYYIHKEVKKNLGGNMPLIKSSILLREDLKEYLRQLSKENGASISGLINIAIEQYRDSEILRREMVNKFLKEQIKNEMLNS